jgi:peptidoglycan/LPS O-acetylase OafA/YrhL
MRRRQELALRSLDGIRAMASIWVALFHVYVIFISNTDEKSWAQTEKTSWLVR